MIQTDPGVGFSASFTPDESKAKWAAAFVAAQAEMPDIHKGKKATIQTKQGGSFSYTYADLADIIKSVQPVLARHYLGVAQSVTADPESVGVTTRIYHAAGHVETFGPLFLPAGGDARAAGSAITYARRYALCAALGITADEDDDGAAAKPKTVAQDNNLLTAAQKKSLHAQTKDLDREKRLEWASTVLDRRIETFDQLSKAEASTLIESLKTTPRKGSEPASQGSPPSSSGSDPAPISMFPIAPKDCTHHEMTATKPDGTEMRAGWLVCRFCGTTEKA